VVAVNVFDGSVHFFDRTLGVPIERAIAASQALSGSYVPITIGDGRYMDGVVRGVNVEPAAGYDAVVFIDPSVRPSSGQDIDAVNMMRPSSSTLPSARPLVRRSTR